jgi:hypothetical protein
MVVREAVYDEVVDRVVVRRFRSQWCRQGSGRQGIEEFVRTKSVAVM